MMQMVVTHSDKTKKKMSNEKNTFLKIIIVCIKDYPLLEEHLYLLPLEARAKINSFKREDDRRRSFASELLKNYYLPLALQIDKEENKIKNGYNSRPYFPEYLSNYDFNISHSQDYVVMTISKNFKVGVDIEYINSKVNCKEISKIVFSEREQVLADTSVKSFYTLWTKKESLFKAIGTGFMDEVTLKKTYLNINAYQIEPFTCGQIFSTRIFDNYMLSVSLLPLNYI